MPYKRKYNTKKKYMKRKYKRTKWKQQKISVGSIQKIAKKAVQSVPETKFTNIYSTPTGNPITLKYDPTKLAQNDPDTLECQELKLPQWFNVNNPLDAKRVSVWEIASPAGIPSGTSASSRIGREIFVKGINLRLTCQSHSDHIGTQTSIRIMVVRVPATLSSNRLNNSGVHSVELPVIDANTFPYNFYVSEQEQRLKHKSQPYQVLYSKWLSINPNRVTQFTATNNTKYSSKLRQFKKYIKIDKRHKYVNRTNINDVGNAQIQQELAKSPIYLVIYGTTNLAPTWNTSGFRGNTANGNNENSLLCKFTTLITYNDT